MIDITAFLPGHIPLDPKLTQCLDEGKNFLDHYEESPTLSAIEKVINTLVRIDRDLPWIELESPWDQLQ